MAVAHDTPVTAPCVIDAVRYHHQAPTVGLHLTPGAAVTVTPDQQILTGAGWRPAVDLRTGDLLVRVPDDQLEKPPRPVGPLVDIAVRQGTPRDDHRAIRLEPAADGGSVELVRVCCAVKHRLECPVWVHLPDPDLVPETDLGRLLATPPAHAAAMAHSPVVRLDELVDAVALAWDAPVYDLTTARGWHLADGLILASHGVKGLT